MKNKFTSSVLHDRHIYQHVLWSHSLLHRDVPAMTEYLRNSGGFLAQCGLDPAGWPERVRTAVEG